MGDSLLAAFAQEVCSFFQSQPVHECLPESSKLLLLDHQVSLSVAIKALDQYKRPFGCVFSPRVPEFTYVFDGFDIVSFAIHVHKYYTDPQYLGQLYETLCSVIQGTHAFSDSLGLVDGEAEPITEEVREILTRDLDRTLRVLSDTFSLRDFEKEEGYLGQLYSEFLAGNRSTAATNDTAAEDDDKENVRTPSYHFSRAHEERMTASTATNADLSMSFDINPAEAHAMSIRRRIELIFPPPWAYNLERWHKLNARTSALPHLSIVHSALDAAKLLLESERSRAIVWDDARATPFSFVTITSLIAHLIQHFRSSSELLNKKVLSELRLGVHRNELIVAPHNIKFVKVLEIMRGRRWSAVPIVDAEDGSFIGLLSVSHVSFLVLRSLSDLEMKWHWDDDVGDIWEILIQAGAAHSKGVRHTYAQCVPKDSSVEKGKDGSSHLDSRRAITSKHGGAFLAKLGDMTEDKQDKMTDSGNDKNCSDLPALVDPPLESDGAVGPADSLPSANATSAVQNLVKNITCSATVVDEDITLRQLIAHLVLTDDRRVIFIDRETSLVAAGESELMLLLLKLWDYSSDLARL